MSGTFHEALLEALDAQLEQQTRLAAFSEAQTTALAARDLETVEALTRAIETAVIDGSSIEQRRAGAAHDLASELGIDPGSVTLRTLQAAAPPTLSAALERRAEALDRSVERLRRTSAVNRALIEGELMTIEHIVRASRRTEPVGYSDAGVPDERLRALLDARA